MKFKIEAKLNDKKAEAISYEIMVFTLEELFPYIQEEFENYQGVPYDVGTTLTITRTE